MTVIKISNSMLVSVANCSTLAMLKTAGWSVKMEAKDAIADEAAMRAGSAAHVALEWWLQGASVETCVEAFRTEYEPFSNLYVAPDKAHNAENLVKILRYFVESHPLDEQPFEVICTEREIEAQLLSSYSAAEPEVRLVDRADGQVSNKESGALQPMEHKTHGKKIYPDWKEGFNVDSQIMTHIFCWRAEGYDVDSVLMNVIPFVRLPQSEFSQNKKTGEWKERACRSRDHSGKPSQCWTLHCQSDMFTATPSKYMYEHWQVEARQAALKYRKLLLQPPEAEIPMDGLKRGYCRRCDFKNFCFTGRSNYELLEKKEAPAWITRSGLYENE